MYDYLIVGAGLFGCVFAQRATAAGKRCLVIDRRSHIAGNVYSEELAGIQVHRYGPHIFHTSDAEVWHYITGFARFRSFINMPLADTEKGLFHMPFNMHTFSALWGITDPGEAREKIARQVEREKVSSPKNLEEQALCLVGRELYELFIRDYTEKQWGRPCTQLPPSIIRRLPIRYTYDNNYFTDTYQGIPEQGYTHLCRQLLAGVEVLLSTDYAHFATENPAIAKKTIYTGQIDEFFGHRLGHLAYRSLAFSTQVLDVDDFQGNAVVNHTHARVPYTRTVEHKHFAPGSGRGKTVVTREIPCAWEPGQEAYYPINDEKNNALYARYAALAAEQKDVLFGGRLGEYRYYDMDKTIKSALTLAESELSGTNEA